MIHNLLDVARYRMLDPIKFKEYACTHQPRRIIDGWGVSSFEVDDVVNGYKSFIGHVEYMADRQAIIKAGIL